MSTNASQLRAEHQFLEASKGSEYVAYHGGALGSSAETLFSIGLPVRMNPSSISTS